ncbi:MAG TPA: GNAT family N-acetyltransferase [Anaerolineae bacterium]|nr:GNAT family N-acetyltransferase [Anaerolineae bacterium]
MEQLIYRVAQRDNYQELAERLVHISQTPEQHCLHSWSGQNSDALWQQLLSYLDDAELRYVIAYRNSKMVGAMGSEYDEELGRGWLHGPHVMTESWDDIASELYARLLKEIPACVRQLDAYLNIANVRGRRFYAQQGFKERESFSYEFWLTADDRVDSSDRPYTLLDERHEASFVRLFHSLFPTAYYSGQRILHMLGGSHQVLVVAEEEEVLGFVVMSTDKSLSAGEIQFFGMREDCRGVGYGRSLLLMAIDWLLDSVGVSQVGLNVGEELIHARSLYESVGFKLQFTGVGLQKILLT